jgi:hypothetical protein
MMARVYRICVENVSRSGHRYFAVHTATFTWAYAEHVRDELRAAGRRVRIESGSTSPSSRFQSPAEAAWRAQHVKAFPNCRAASGRVCLCRDCRKASSTH